MSYIPSLLRRLYYSENNYFLFFGSGCIFIFCIWKYCHVQLSIHQAQHLLADLKRWIVRRAAVCWKYMGVFCKPKLLLNIDKIRNKLDTLKDDDKREIFVHNYNAGDKEFEAFEQLIPTKATCEENATCIMILVKFDHTKIKNCLSYCITNMWEDGYLNGSSKIILIIYDEKFP